MLLGLWKANLKSVETFLTRSIHLIYGKVYYTFVYIRRQSKGRVAVSILDLLKALQESFQEKTDPGASLALTRHCWATMTGEGFSGRCCPTPGFAEPVFWSGTFHDTSHAANQAVSNTCS